LPNDLDWSLVLCRYGIEYVEDPATRKRIPTINRAQFTSIFDDDNYKSALQYADGFQKPVYEEEAKAINEIQKSILAISQKEEPFDVFICYKETDNNGRRTPDSVLANDLYHQLVQEGFKVFFSRITLEDKLGSAYEPYIFAALNSAKVMVVLGTREEYFKAVWVRNEWSRFLSLIKSGAPKILIPAYRDMDPYDLPEEFSHLQAQDMSKLGFMQDLIRGIKKIVQATAPKTATVVKETVINSAASNISPLLKRAFMFLEYEDWASADEYCEKVLDIDPECAEAYLGKLMAEFRVQKREGVKNSATPIHESNNYKLAVRFAADDLKKEIIGYADCIVSRIENKRLQGIYNQSKQMMSMAVTEAAYKNAARSFESIKGFLDSEALAEECYEKAEIARKDAILTESKNKMHGNSIKSCRAAIELLQTIPGWRDADEMIDKCNNIIDDLKAKREAERIEQERLEELERIAAEERAKRYRRYGIIVSIVTCVAVVILIVLNTWIFPLIDYNKAVDLMSRGRYEEAQSIFINLGDYKDSVDKSQQATFEIDKKALRNCKANDIVRLGNYEQDNVPANGQEKIEWVVLDVEDGKALLLSRYCLDCMPYEAEKEQASWGESLVRDWLNNEFYNTAFSNYEKSMISLSNVASDQSANDNTVEPGVITEDHVFLLSVTECREYLDSVSDRKCIPTAYAVNNGASGSHEGVSTYWWLRTTSNNHHQALYVDDSGSIRSGGLKATSTEFRTVRPAIWIDLENIQ